MHFELGDYTFKEYQLSIDQSSPVQIYITSVYKNLKKESSVVTNYTYGIPINKYIYIL
jgi:hypothetical protein